MKENTPKKRKMGPPPGRGPRRMGPPPNASEESPIIVPDFAKWRDVFFKIDGIIVYSTLILDLFFWVLYCLVNRGSADHVMVLLLQVSAPSIINLLILGLSNVPRNYMPKDNLEMRQNLLPIVTLLLISLNITIFHHQHTVSLAIYCIPIFMSTMFTNKPICKITFIVSMVFASIPVLIHIITAATPQERLLTLLDSTVMFLTLIVATQVSMALLGMTQGQREKLTEFTQITKEAQLRAEAANYAKSAFLANMSHEIRTPINAILGMDEMILRESKDPQITEYADNIYSASASLLSLVNDVLDISKIESGKLEIIENDYDTASLIHDCCNMINERITKKHLKFQVFCNPNLPAQLRGDEPHLRQIITNLLSNAAKYTEKGTITMSVDQVRTQDTFALTISVADTGVGIKEENLEKLFSQFTRFDLEKNRNIEGTGLGLSITKQLVDLMNGEIKAESTYGEGSTFSVRVPQKVINETPMGNFQANYQEATRPVKTSRKKFEAPTAKILIVDDVEVNLKVAFNLLKQTKIHVDTANSGKRCLEKVAETAYDIIFMDHMMPEMNGIETYAKMKEMENSPNKNTPVIMLTANAIMGVKEEYLKEGFSDYLSKPILGNKLEDMIIKYLPEDKVELIDSEADTQEEPEAVEEIPKQPGTRPLVLLQNLFQLYPKIDISQGLSFCGQSTDIYISLLHTLCKQLAGDELQTHFERRDEKQYEIVIHDRKIFFSNTGFVHLTQQAQLLEAAAQAGDWDAIAQAHPLFQAECQTVIDNVKQTLDRRKR